MSGCKTNAGGRGLTLAGIRGQTASRFEARERPIFGGRLSDDHPGHVGSCILLNVNGRRIVLTAAHIALAYAKIRWPQCTEFAPSLVCRKRISLIRPQCKFSALSNSQRHVGTLSDAAAGARSFSEIKELG